MKRYTYIFLALVATIICLNACEKSNDNIISSGDVIINKKENKITTNDYEAYVSFDGDHYVLNIFTNLLNREISFKIKKDVFLLDNTGSAFENAIIVEEGEFTKYTINLESNTLYNFNIIKLGNEELVLSKNLIIE